MTVPNKIVQFTCLMTSLAAASQSLELAWLDITDGNSDNSVMPSFKVDVPISEQKNDCFQVSHIKGRTDSRTTFISDFGKLKKGYYHGMGFHKLRLCGSSS